VWSRQEKVELVGKMGGRQHLLQGGRQEVGPGEARRAGEEPLLARPEETELAVPLLAARGQVEGLSTHPLGAMSSLTE